MVFELCYTSNSLTNWEKLMLFISPNLMEVLDLIEPYIFERHVTIRRVRGLWYGRVDK